MPKKIGQGRYQKVYRDLDKVIKVTPAEADPFSQINRIERYHAEIRGKGIRVPKHFKSEFNKKKGIVETQWEYCGEDLRKVIANSSIEKRKNLLDQVRSFALLAGKTAFHPIFEQFTVKNNKVYFIDFYPSRTLEDFSSYPKEKRDALKKMFFGKRNRANTIKREQNRYTK